VGETTILGFDHGEGRYEFDEGLPGKVVYREGKGEGEGKAKGSPLDPRASGAEASGALSRGKEVGRVAEKNKMEKDKMEVGRVVEKNTMGKDKMEVGRVAEKMAETILTARDPHGDHGVLARAVIALSIVRSPPLSAWTNGQTEKFLIAR
jgi:hypothetical protein